MSTSETVAAIMKSPEGLFFCPRLAKNSDNPAALGKYVRELMFVRGDGAIMTPDYRLHVGLQIYQLLDGYRLLTDNTSEPETQVA